MNKKLLASAGALIALGVASGGAFTAANTMTAGAQTAGFGNVTASGAEVTNIDFTHSADGTQIDSATLKLAGDQSAKTVKVGFGTTADKNCAAGTYDATTTVTTVSCTALAQDISTTSSFNVSVLS